MARARKQPAAVAPEAQGPVLKTARFILTGRPGTPLVIHAFSAKAKQEIRDKQQKKAKEAKAKRDPKAEFLEARYLDHKKRECAPIMAIKKAAINAATAMDNLTKVALRQAFFVWPTVAPDQLLVPIEQPGKPGRWVKGRMREDAVTIGINTRGLTYRPEYPEWQLRVTAEYNERLITQEQLLALLTQAGWGVGIGEGRPEKSSALGWGRFLVTLEK